MGGDEVEARPWPEFIRWFKSAWVPGQHVALVGPTGTGKSTLACHILRLRWYVLGLDPKGGDSTLASSGLFRRVGSWPPPTDVRKRIEKGQEEGGGPVRLIVGPVVHDPADRVALREAIRAALNGAFTEGGWTLYIDELQLATDRRIMGLGPEVEQILIAARDKKVSLVTSYQAPSWVPPSASRQASWVAMWRTMDKDVVDKMANVLGRDKLMIRAAVEELGDYDVLFGGRRLSDPLLVTCPPPIMPLGEKDADNRR
jgi:hypothetical protein